MKPKHPTRNDAFHPIKGMTSLTAITSLVSSSADIMPKSCRGVAKVVAQKVYKHASRARLVLRNLTEYHNCMSWWSIREAGIDEEFLENIPYIFSEENPPFLITIIARVNNSAVTEEVVASMENTLVSSMIEIFPNRPIILSLQKSIYGHITGFTVRNHFNRRDTHESSSLFREVFDSADGRTYIVYNFPEGTTNDTCEGKRPSESEPDFSMITEPIHIPNPPAFPNAVGILNEQTVDDGVDTDDCSENRNE